MLLNPKQHVRFYPDERSREVMRKTIDFFERKGKIRLKEDYHANVWYADFLDFVREEKIFATMCTPAGYGAADARWDTWRICEFAEILGFYGLQYWYTWQVSVLGLGPIWMSDNEAVKQRAARALEEGGIFAFGLSEQAHGADIYSTDMILTPKDEGVYSASGRKYYIGNGNKAAIVSTFGKLAGSDDYVFFASEFALEEYPLTEADILHKGRDAFYAALNTVNIGKYNLGWASIGICTHALYEAVTHAHNRRLYGMRVTEFPHVKRMFLDAYARLVAMKLFALRACDYMRSASADDRRYLLYNPMVKMKVTSEGERVINLLWDVIAAKGFEKSMYFSQAAVDIRGLPKLEGTVHVNIALIVKFMPNFFFTPGEYPPVATQSELRNDDFLFRQGGTKGLGQIQFHDYRKAFEGVELPNVKRFAEQAEIFRELLMTDPPGPAQMKDIAFLLAGGEIFALVVYSQLILENAPIHDIPDHLLDQIFDFMVRDMSRFALQLHSQPSSTPAQMACCLRMIQKAVHDPARYDRVWREDVAPLSGAYEMNP